MRTEDTTWRHKVLCSHATAIPATNSIYRHEGKRCDLDTARHKGVAPPSFLLHIPASTSPALLREPPCTCHRRREGWLQGSGLAKSGAWGCRQGASVCTPRLWASAESCKSLQGISMVDLKPGALPWFPCTLCPSSPQRRGGSPLRLHRQPPLLCPRKTPLRRDSAGGTEGQGGPACPPGQMLPSTTLTCPCVPAEAAGLDMRS